MKNIKNLLNIICPKINFFKASKYFGENNYILIYENVPVILEIEGKFKFPETVFTIINNHKGLEKLKEKLMFSSYCIYINDTFIDFSTNTYFYTRTCNTQTKGA